MYWYIIWILVSSTVETFKFNGSLVEILQRATRDRVAVMPSFQLFLIPFLVPASRI